MSIEKWSPHVTVAHLANDPQFTEDMAAIESPAHGIFPSIVLDFGDVKYINSSNIARLLRLRKQMVTHDARLILCNISTAVWSAFLVTGLDKVFEVKENVMLALTTLQMED